ncbi:MAG: pyrimidine/purine nucleoside phosphorylase [Yersiniaceae bacterium]|uniref:Pyrimidine/purine nucleoside phosphorylase n=1 Tax=Chimaeribacter coloradensis TaxID=2060068 RepID=A0A2N5EAU3_9GAMM|nr:pyrimidine/purine nucleoside phosphorylase [Chimaeribacter coloradensis]MDU6412678.1 pyrimidine/purine nucleoside phosphorylase [Yersiniaceae bacterium]PLR39239.1 pyrimidine/purine nucleoside phosphorylase [Chimaeribacter coloradensis]
MLNVNDYFSGKVKSIGYESGTIGSASVGVMEVGEYTFGTKQAEEMTVITGALRVLIPGSPDWQVFMPGETFYVPAHSEFNLQVSDTTAYLCKYLSK